MKKILITLMVVIMMVGLNVKANESNVIFSGKFDSINGTRYQDYLVYYDYKTKGSSPGTNSYGFEVAFNKDGIAVQINTNVTIPVDGFVISGHGNKVDLLKKIQIGDRALVDLTNKSVVVIRDDLSKKMMANLRLEEAINAKNSAYNSGIIYDEKIVDELIENIKAKINSMENASSSKIERLANEVSVLVDEVIYRTSYTKSVEVRAVWHRPNGTTISERSLNGIIRLLTKFKDIGINTVFLETFWNGYASYNSSILETHPRVGLIYYGEEYGYDYVKAFIGEAKKLGIEVHAWLHLFNAGSIEYKSKVVKDEWLVENYQGNKVHPTTYGGSYYYDPSNEELLTFIESVIIEIVTKYDFKGIQYDYVRYYDNNYNQTPIKDSGFGEHSEKLFKEAYNLTGDVRELVKQTKYRNMWNEWRQGVITNAVKKFSKNIHNLNPNMIISAAVVSNLESARNTYMQDWYTWVKNGYIDMLAPMIYTGSSEVVFNDTKDILGKLGNLTYLVSGIAPIYYHYSVMTQHNQIQATNKAAGHSLFASQNVVNLTDVENSLIYGRYRNDVLNITTNPRKLVNYYLENLYEQIVTLSDKRKLINESSKMLFLEEINLIKEMDKNNISDLAKVREKLNNLANLTMYIGNPSVQTTIKEDISTFTNILDITISRYLINNGYWDPETNTTRPDVTKMDFPDFEDDEIGNEDDQDNIDDDNQNQNPNEGENNDKIEKDGRKGVYIGVGITSIVLIIIGLYYLIFRRKVKA